jgi:hypothetical protein
MTARELAQRRPLVSSRYYPNNPYPTTALIGDSFLKFIPDYFDPDHELSPVIISVPGARFEDLLDEIPFIPDTVRTVTIVAGTNDLRSPRCDPANVVFALRRFLRALQCSLPTLTHIRIHMVPPRIKNRHANSYDNSVFCKHFNERALQYNKQLENLHVLGVYVCNHGLGDDDLRDVLQLDGVHPSRIGLRALTNNIKQFSAFASYMDFTSLPFGPYEDVERATPGQRPESLRSTRTSGPPPPKQAQTAAPPKPTQSTVVLPPKQAQAAPLLKQTSSAPLRKETLPALPPQQPHKATSNRKETVERTDARGPVTFSGSPTPILSPRPVASETSIPLANRYSVLDSTDQDDNESNYDGTSDDDNESPQPKEKSAKEPTKFNKEQRGAREETQFKEPEDSAALPVTATGVESTHDVLSREPSCATSNSALVQNHHAETEPSNHLERCRYDLRGRSQSQPSQLSLTADRETDQSSQETGTIERTFTIPPGQGTTGGGLPVAR